MIIAGEYSENPCDGGHNRRRYGAAREAPIPFRWAGGVGKRRPGSWEPGELEAVSWKLRGWKLEGWKLGAGSWKPEAGNWKLGPGAGSWKLRAGGLFTNRPQH